MHIQSLCNRSYVANGSIDSTPFNPTDLAEFKFSPVRKLLLCDIFSLPDLF